MRISAFSLAIGLALISSRAASGGAIWNGDFDTPGAGPPAGNSGWVTTNVPGPPVEVGAAIIAGGAVNAAGGANNYADVGIDSLNASELYQTFLPVPMNGWLTVSFTATFIDPKGATDVAYADLISAGGSGEVQITANKAAAIYTVTIPLCPPMATILFVVEDNGAGGLIGDLNVDNVVDTCVTPGSVPSSSPPVPHRSAPGSPAPLMPVPEPASSLMLLIGTGAVALGARWERRARRDDRGDEGRDAL